MSELALKLIAENKRTCSPFLDLGNCGLTEVPEEIGELEWLEELSFASEWTYFDYKKAVTKYSQNTGPRNNIKRLAPVTFWRCKSLAGMSVNSSPFSSLIKLKKLNLTGGWGKSMAINDLSPLSGLVNLQELSIRNTQVTNLSPLLSLANL